MYYLFTFKLNIFTLNRKNYYTYFLFYLFSKVSLRREKLWKYICTFVNIV